MTSIRWVTTRTAPGWARLRAFWNVVVRRYECELCQDCGRRYDGFLWYAEDALWSQVVQDWQRDEAGRWYVDEDGQRRYEGEVRAVGLLCPRCFTRRADARGLWLNWEPRLDHPYKRAVAVTEAESAT